MKFQTVIIAAVLLLVPASTYALDGFPAFPMAFWGTVTTNGVAAPVGSVVRAYYGFTLVGTATVQEAGVYGYTEPTKQKLIVAEGTGAITFKIQASGFNSGSETTGDTAITQDTFTSGLTVQKNLAFTITPPPSGGGNGGGSSSGGGGGGGGSASGGSGTVPAVPATPATPTVTSAAPAVPATPARGRVLGAAVYNFTINLKMGSNGADVTTLQRILIDGGHLSIGRPTGTYGPLTAAAVRKYQAAHGIEQTGTVGPKTRAALNAGVTSFMSDEQRTALIAQLQTQLKALMDQLNALIAARASSGQ